jgi:hypothetical protein
MTFKLSDLYRTGGKFDPAKAATSAGMAALAYGALNKDSGLGKFLGMGSNQRPVGYSEGIPEYTATRELAPNAFATTTPTGEPRRPGSGGRRYFTDMTYTPTGKTMGPKPSGGVYDSLTSEEAQYFLTNLFNNKGVANTGGTTTTNTGGTTTTNTGGTTNTNTGGTTNTNTGGTTNTKAPKFTDAEVKATLDTLIAQNPNRGEGLYRAIGEQIKSSGVSIESAAKQIASLMPEFSEQEIIAKYKQMGFAQGGLASLPQSRGYYLGGATDGMADQIPANINGQQEAALSDGEFVMPADVVSHLGNGNSDAGAKVLYSMMDRVRQARTGTKEQGRKITPNKFTPV